ncbi:MAG: hypothetical protein H6746_06755 [Deltaproteobacteria bacterium]|nr:hypothetical protein [Deltaproteobacteria bacterium]
MNQAADIDTIRQTAPLDIGRLAAALDAMADADRVALVRTWDGKFQRQLWDACQGRSTTLTDFVPADVAPGVEVIHAGRNSLPVFKTFEKRFCVAVGRPDALYGYNEGATRGLIGPGYYVAREFPERGEVGVDYLQVPPEDAKLPAGWPSIRPNESGLQRFVYANMIDYLRKVSSHVTIGRAYKGGTEELPHTFLLVRSGAHA